MKILIAFATKSGTTRICAQKLAELLPQHEVHVKDLSENCRIKVSDFDFAVIGAPIRMGRLHKAARKFIEESTLIPKKYAFFICNGLSEETNAYFKRNFPGELLNSALVFTSLGGELKPDRQRGLDRIILRAILDSNRDNEDFVMPSIFTEEIGRLADRIKEQVASGHERDRE